MSVVMEAPRAVPKDRIFYTGMAVASAIIVFVGFSPTFFTRSAELGPLSPLLFVHGIAFTAWLVLLVSQTGLIAAQRRDLHRKLGVVGVALAFTMVVLGMLVAVDLLNRGVVPIPGLNPRSFFAIPVRDILTFAILAGAGIHFRRDAEMHKRLMLIATITLLAAAIARMPIPGMATLGPPLFYGLQDLLIVIGILYDRFTRGRVHRAYGWGLGLMVGSQVLFLAISGTAPWFAVAELFMRG